jgi:hypothetical protein
MTSIEFGVPDGGRPHRSAAVRELQMGGILIYSLNWSWNI